MVYGGGGLLCQVHLTVNKSSIRANGEEGKITSIVGIVTLQPADAEASSGITLSSTEIQNLGNLVQVWVVT